MREPSRFREPRRPFPAPRGLILAWDEVDSILWAIESSKSRRGAVRMPRPCYRWSRRRGVMRFARLRRPVPLLPPMLDHASNDAGIRHDLVSRVRREIDAGTYDDPAKMEAALERMMDAFGDD